MNKFAFVFTFVFGLSGIAQLALADGMSVEITPPVKTIQAAKSACASLKANGSKMHVATPQEFIIAAMTGVLGANAMQKVSFAVGSDDSIIPLWVDLSQLPKDQIDPSLTKIQNPIMGYVPHPDMGHGDIKDYSLFLSTIDSNLSKIERGEVKNPLSAQEIADSVQPIIAKSDNILATEGDLAPMDEATVKSARQSLERMRSGISAVCIEGSID